VDDEVATLVNSAISRLVDAGARVELADPGFDDPSETFRDHWYTYGDEGKAVGLRMAGGFAVCRAVPCVHPA
jgi:hypothetical protein